MIEILILNICVKYSGLISCRCKNSDESSSKSISNESRISTAESDILGMSSTITSLESKVPFGFGIDESTGEYGYLKVDEQGVNPFSGNSNVTLRRYLDGQPIQDWFAVPSYSTTSTGYIALQMLASENIAIHPLDDNSIFYISSDAARSSQDPQAYGTTTVYVRKLDLNSLTSANASTKFQGTYPHRVRPYSSLCALGSSFALSICEGMTSDANDIYILNAPATTFSLWKGWTPNKNPMGFCCDQENKVLWSVGSGNLVDTAQVSAYYSNNVRLSLQWTQHTDSPIPVSSMHLVQFYENKLHVISGTDHYTTSYEEPWTLEGQTPCNVTLTSQNEYGIYMMPKTQLNQIYMYDHTGKYTKLKSVSAFQSTYRPTSMAVKGKGEQIYVNTAGELYAINTTLSGKARFIKKVTNATSTSTALESTAITTLQGNSSFKKYPPHIMNLPEY